MNMSLWERGRKIRQNWKIRRIIKNGFKSKPDNLWKWKNQEGKEEADIFKNVKTRNKNMHLKIKMKGKQRRKNCWRKQKKTRKTKRKQTVLFENVKPTTVMFCHVCFSDTKEKFVVESWTRGHFSCQQSALTFTTVSCFHKHVWCTFWNIAWEMVNGNDKIF